VFLKQKKITKPFLLTNFEVQAEVYTAESLFLEKKKERNVSGVLVM
jgi:hypothetical protein